MLVLAGPCTAYITRNTTHLPVLSRCLLIPTTTRHDTTRRNRNRNRNRDRDHNPTVITATTARTYARIPAPSVISPSRPFVYSAHQSRLAVHPETGRRIYDAKMDEALPGRQG